MAWLNTAQALATLGVRPQTLYASVSRHKIRTRPDPGDSRRSLYQADDVRRLAQRHGGRRRSEAVAAAAIGWGEPVLQTRISTVVAGRLWYRGRDAVKLAESHTLEDIAGLLWEGPPPVLHTATGPSTTPRPASLVSGADRPIQRALLALAADATQTWSAKERSAPDEADRDGWPGEDSPAALPQQAADVLATLADALLGAATEPSPLHQRLARAWGRPESADLLRMALVLLADHELNASTFAARVTASTGASLSASVLAGLATLTGPAHGGASARVPQLVQEAQRDGAAQVLRRHLTQGQASGHGQGNAQGPERGDPAQGLGRGHGLAAFGHPLYPAGDVRATALLARITLPPGFAVLRDAAQEVLGEPPNVDFALAALTQAWHLPTEAPLTLFALARCVGWLAHAQEQIATGSLIRPRARYIGPALGQDEAKAAGPAASKPHAGPWDI